MKASNIILFSMIGSITLLIITGAMQIRFGDHADKAGSEESNLQSQTIELSDFSYVVVNNFDLTLTLAPGSKSEFEIGYEEGFEKPVFHYNMKGDTLVIDSLEWSDKHAMYHFKLVMPETVASIKARNAFLSIQDCDNDRLQLNLQNARVNLDENNRFHSLDISGNNRSSVNSYLHTLDSLTLDLDNSQMNVNGIVGKLKGSMQNHSELSIKEVNEFAFKKDGSCRLNHWN